MKLAELQRGFFGRISSPAPIEDERLNVYGQMYFHRLLDAVREDFPAVLTVVGDDRFAEVAAELIEKNPPRDPSLRRFGDAFPDHLSGALRDLARLERARTDAFDAADAEPLARADVARLTPESRLRLVPAARLVDLEFDVEAAWLAADRREPIPDMPRAARSLLVWRRGFVVFHRALDAGERAALHALKRGGTFAEACEAYDDAPSAVRALEQWIADELVCR